MRHTSRRTASALVGLVLLLVACSGDGTTEPSAPTSAPPSSTDPAAAADDGSSSGSPSGGPSSDHQGDGGWPSPLPEPSRGWRPVDAPSPILAYATDGTTDLVVVFDKDAGTGETLWRATGGGPWEPVAAIAEIVGDGSASTADLDHVGGRFVLFPLRDGGPLQVPMFTSVDGVTWEVETRLARGAAPPSLPGLHATPESPPWPMEVAVWDVAPRASGDGWVATGWVPDDAGTVAAVWTTGDGTTWDRTLVPRHQETHEWGARVASGPPGTVVALGGPLHLYGVVAWSDGGPFVTANVADIIGDPEAWLGVGGVAATTTHLAVLAVDGQDDGATLVTTTDLATWRPWPLPGGARSVAGSTDLVFVSLCEDDLAGGSVWSIDPVDGTVRAELSVPDGCPILETTTGGIVAAAGQRAWIAPLRTTTAAVALVALDDVLNVRATPSPSAPIVGTLAPTDPWVPLTGRERAVGGQRWVEIADGATVGWVNAFFLADRPALEALDDETLLQTTAAFAEALRRGDDLRPWTSSRGLFVAHFDRPRRFPPEALRTIVRDPTLYTWGSPGCDPSECPQATFGERVATSLANAWYDADRIVAIDEVLTGPGGTLPEAVVPHEFANLRFVAVQDPGDDPDAGGLDWRTWYVFFDVEDGRPVVVGLAVDMWGP